MSNEDLRAWCHGELRAPADSQIYARAQAILRLLDDADAGRKALSACFDIWGDYSWYEMRALLPSVQAAWYVGLVYGGARAAVKR